jgi:hypothetical protein
MIKPAGRDQKRCRIARNEPENRHDRVVRQLHEDEPPRSDGTRSGRWRRGASASVRLQGRSAGPVRCSSLFFRCRCFKNASISAAAGGLLAVISL